MLTTVSCCRNSNNEHVARTLMLSQLCLLYQCPDNLAAYTFPAVKYLLFLYFSCTVIRS